MYIQTIIYLHDLLFMGRKPDLTSLRFHEQAFPPSLDARNTGQQFSVIYLCITIIVIITIIIACRIMILIINPHADILALSGTGFPARRSPENQGQGEVYIYIYICMYVCVCVYIYIYIYTHLY